MGNILVRNKNEVSTASASGKLADHCTKQGSTGSRVEQQADGVGCLCKVRHLRHAIARSPSSEKICGTASNGSVEEPRIVFNNASRFHVSFSVASESAIEEEATQRLQSMEASLIPGTAGGAQSGVEEQEGIGLPSAKAEDPLFLACDKRMEPSSDGEPKTTTILFPQGHKQFRVYGYFLADDGNWTRYKNKVYSIARRNKIFTLTAVDRRLELYNKGGGEHVSVVLHPLPQNRTLLILNKLTCCLQALFFARTACYPKHFKLLYSTTSSAII